MRRLLGALSLALLLGFGPTPAGAGALAGELSLGPGRAGRRARVMDGVVWLESVPERVEKRRTSRGWFWNRRPIPPLARLDEAELRFRPHVLAVAVGSAVEIRNRDIVWHGAFSVSPTERFELGKRPPGKADTVRFLKVGVVVLRCDIHPDMSAYIVVTPNHALARPDASGHWQLGNLPEGEYVVHAWHPDREELRRRVAVPARGSRSLSLRW